MRYDFECATCRIRWEITCRMSERPASLPCQCGGEAVQIITSVPEVMVKGVPYKFDPKKNVDNFGKSFGRTNEQQHEGYRQAFDMQRKLVHERKRSLSKKSDDDPVYLGGMPVEMVLSIGQKEGDPEIAFKDPEYFLKTNNLHMGE